MRLHHHHQVPVTGLSQWFRLYRPVWGRWGIGVVIWRHEFSVTFGEDAL